MRRAPARGRGDEGMTFALQYDAAPMPGKSKPAPGLIVQGVRFVHSAAQFWAGLLEEVAADYSTCDSMAFEILTDLALARDLLFPETALQRELHRLPHWPQRKEAWRAALVQLAVLGPPGAVGFELSAQGVAQKSCSLPLDCVDAEIFPCLLVWLLEWSEVPQCLWNRSALQGGFTAQDRAGRVRYGLRWELENTHLSEGLYRRRLLLRYTRQASFAARRPSSFLLSC